MDTWIFAHGDVDGICSAAIALAANPRARVFFSHPYGLVGDLDEARDYNRIIVCDISLSESHIRHLLDKFSKISEKGELIYIDHHPLPNGLTKEDIPGKVVHRVGSSASELTYSLFEHELNFMHARIAIYGAIGDYLDDTPLIQRLLEGWDKRTLYFESGLLVQAIEGRKRDYELKRNIVSNLAMNLPPSFDKRLVDLAVQHSHVEEIAIRELKHRILTLGEIAYVVDFPFSLGKTATYIKGLAGVAVGVAGEERRSMIDMSLRTNKPEIDLNKILRRIASRFGGGGGGHPNAAGARIPKERFKEFLRELNREVEESLSKA